MDETGRKRPPAPARKPTIHDVAQAAEVAVGTVSRYLNGRSVRGASLQRIEDAVARLGFVKNVAAATIRNDVSRLIGFLVSSYDELQINLLAQLTARMQARDRIVLPITHDGSATTMTKALRFFGEHRIEALVASGDFAAMRNSPLLRTLDTHIILFNNDIPDLDCDRVMFADASGMQRAVAHLAALGHRRIGLISGRPEHSSAVGRLEGYRSGLIEAGLTVDDDLIAGHEWSRETGYRAGMRFLDGRRPPTAVVGASYLATLGLLDLLAERGMAVPDAMSVISFGDADFLRLIGPGIDAVTLPVLQVVDGIECLYLTRESRRQPVRLMIDNELIVRGSSRAPASG